MLTACINVCAKSVADSSDSGTADPPPEGARGRTIEMQFERVRLEKQLLEKTSTTLEEKNRLVVATNDQLNRSNRELRDEVRNLKLENDRIRVQVRRNKRVFRSHFLTHIIHRTRTVSMRSIEVASWSLRTRCFTTRWSTSLKWCWRTRIGRRPRATPSYPSPPPRLPRQSPRRSCALARP